MLSGLRYGWRGAIGAPLSSLLAVSAMTLGIGGSTAIFSFVNAILLAPLPYARPDGLVLVSRNNREQGFSRMLMLSEEVGALREQAGSFAEVSGFEYRDVHLGGEEGPERCVSASVLPDLLPLLGVEPALGRVFLPEEVEARDDGAVVLSDRLWRRRFGGDTAVLGQSVRIDGRRATVVGVLPRGVELPLRDVDLVMPLSPDTLQREPTRFLRVLGRLGPGASLETARQEADAVVRRVAEERSSPVRSWGADVEPLRGVIVGDVERTLMVLFGAVVLVLLIACANVAGLLLGRGASRRREVALRAALGATRARIFRQLLTEGVLLAAAGGGLGVLFALGATRTLVALTPSNVPRLDGVGIDAGVLAFTAVLSVGAGLAAGLLPALGGSRLDIDAALRSRRAISGAAPRRFRAALSIAQLALALTLLTGSGLMIRSFWHLLAVDPGFVPGSVLTMQLSLPEHLYPDATRQSALIENVLERVGALKGVDFAAGSSWTPMTGSWGRAQVSVEAVSGSVLEQEQWPLVLGVTPGYFKSLGLPLLQGRDFTLADRREGAQAVIVNRRLAERAWPGESPLGRRLKFGRPDNESAWMTVIGVAGDARLIGVADEAVEGMFLPLLGSDRTLSSVQLVARTAGEPRAASSAIQDAIRQIDPELPVDRMSTMDELFSRDVSRPRFRLIVVGAFAWMAITLAGIGVYGVVSESVSQRRGELGLRMALGAGTRDVLALIARQGASIVLSGLLAGLALAFGLSRLLTSLLYEVRATDGATFAFASFLLVAIGVLAFLVPARRACRVDPMSALRQE